MARGGGNNMSYGDGCEKCSCTKFYSSDPGLYDHHTWPGGWIERPSRKCMCGHKSAVHTIYKPPPAGHGAIATYFVGAELRFSATTGHASEAEAVEGLLSYCAVDMGGSNPVVRVRGYRRHLAIAQSADGRKLGWASEYVRSTAETLAAKNCGDRKRPFVFSVNAAAQGDADQHTHHSGEPYCRK